MKKRGRILGACVVGLFLFLGTAEAGWVIHAESRGSRMGTDKETTFFQKQKIRSDSGDHANIMDFSTRRILWIDLKQKKYSSMTFEEFKQVMRESMRQAGAAMEEMKKAGIQLPGQSKAPRGKVTVSKGPGATVAGYACDGYRVSVGGKLTEEIWVTRKIDLSSEMGRNMMKEFEDLNRELKKMGADFRQEVDDPEYARIYEGGYPMRSVDKESGFVHEVTRVERKEISADTFGEPKGYAKVPLREQFGLPAEGPGAAKLPATKRPKAAVPSGEAAGAPSAPSEAPSSAAGQKAADYGKQSAGQTTDAAKQGATQPFEEKKGEGLDAIKEGVSGGIKKLFKW